MIAHMPPSLFMLSHPTYPSAPQDLPHDPRAQLVFFETARRHAPDMHTYMDMGDVYMRMYYTIVQCTRKAGRSFCLDFGGGWWPV